MHDNLWKVGELATQTGLSVRTLHYYDEIGLLSPSRRTGSGHRLYGADDVVRLQLIKSCRQLGFSLAEIRDLLSRPDYAPQQVIQLHIERLEEQIQLQRRLCSRLEAIAKRLRAAEQVSVDEFVSAIKEIEMVEQFEKYYTPQQLQELEKRREVVGEDRIREAEGEWKQLLEQIRSEMAKGTDPASETMQRLAKRYQGLIDEFTGGNKEIEESLRRMYKAEPDIAGDKGYSTIRQWRSTSVNPSPRLATRHRADDLGIKWLARPGAGCRFVRWSDEETVSRSRIHQDPRMDAPRCLNAGSGFDNTAGVILRARVARKTTNSPGSVTWSTRPGCSSSVWVPDGLFGMDILNNFGLCVFIPSTFAAQ